MAQENIRRKVKVEAGYLTFSSAHFITYSGKCERLHGHNYGVLVEVEGELNENKVVFDFTILKRLAKEICQRLDHRFLLPLHNPDLELVASADSWQIRFRNKCYIFPRTDVIELPIENSTAKLQPNTSATNSARLYKNTTSPTSPVSQLASKKPLRRWPITSARYGNRPKSSPSL